MKYDIKHAAHRLPRLPLAAALAILSAAVSAQTSPAQNPPAANGEQSLEEIVITGTLIRGAAEVGSSVVSVGQQQIQDTGLQETADVIRSLPFVSLSGPSEVASQSTSNAANLNVTRLNGINIRGLGVQATLTLLDGRRVVPGGVGGQVFDPSSIPTIALERIEIVPDGASATYGSDAVAGVANLILRKNYEGAEFQASDGWSKGFAGQDKFSAIAGHAWEGGSIMVAGEFFSHPHLRTGTYANEYDSNQTAVGGIDQRTPGGAPGNITTNTGTYGLPAGNGVGVTPAEFSPNINKIDPNYGADILPSAERHSFVMSIQQDVNDKIHLWGEGYYTDRFGVLANGPLVQSNISVPASNPFYIPAAAVACFPGGPAACNNVTYSFANDLAPQTRIDQSQADQLAIGARFDLPHGFEAEVYYTNNTDKESDLTTGLLNATALDAALALTDPATALNVYGSGGNNNPATLRSIVGTSLNSSQYNLSDIDAKVDGPLFNWGSDPVRVALGGEWHHDKLSDVSNYSNTGTANVDTYSTAYVTSSSRSVGSEFVEVLVPLVGTRNARPGVQSLMLDVAGRRDDYSDVGSTTNPKVGLSWEPSGDFSIRGSYGKSFRAPTLCDLNPVCTSTIATFPTADPGAYLNHVPFAPGLSVAAFRVGGNSSLVPETARTYSFGGDFHPVWLSGLKVSLNYFNIDYKNIIDTPAAFNASISTNPYYANLFVRNPTVAQVLAFWNSAPAANPSSGFPPFLVNLLVNGNRQNAGEAKEQGFDISAAYTIDTDLGAWTAGITSEYVFQYLYSVINGAPFVERVNEVEGTSTAFPLRLAARGQLGWNDKGFRVNAFVNYHNGYTNVLPTVLESPPPEQHIGSFTTVDLTASYDTGDVFGGIWRNTTVGVQATNLFNRLPPFALIGTTTYDPANASVVGRLTTINFRKKF